MSHSESDRSYPARDLHQALGNQLAVFACDKALDEADGDIDDTAAIVASMAGQAIGMGVDNLSRFHADPDAAQAFLYAVMNEAVGFLHLMGATQQLTGFLAAFDVDMDEEPLDDDTTD